MEDAVFQSLASLTWPGAFVVVGMITVAVSGLIRFFKKEINPEIQNHTEELIRLTNELEKVSKDVAHLREEDCELKLLCSEDKRAFFKVISKLEEKIEKVSDLIIEVIRAQNS